MSKLKELVDAYVGEHGSSEAWVAGRMGVSRSALNGWWTRGRTNPPTAAQLRSLAVAIRVPYQTVLDATLHDYGYLPLKAGQAHGQTPAEKIPTVREVTPIEFEVDPEPVRKRP